MIANRRASGTAFAQKLWNEAADVRGTLAEKYLNSEGSNSILLSPACFGFIRDVRSARV